MLCRRIVPACLAVVLLALPAAAQQPTKEPLPGVRNFAHLETTVACGGATSPAAIPELKKMGYASDIDLRLSSEAGANIEGEKAAAEAGGMHFVHIPFSAASPDPKAVDRFIEVIATPGMAPAYIHCSGGGRAAAMWFAKRLVVDHWDVARAEAEARGLGMKNQKLEDFMIQYASKHTQ